MQCPKPALTPSVRAGSSSWVFTLQTGPSPKLHFLGCLCQGAHEPAAKSPVQGMKPFSLPFPSELTSFVRCQAAALPAPGLAAFQRCAKWSCYREILLDVRVAREMSSHHFQCSVSAVLVTGSGWCEPSVRACGSIQRSEAGADAGAYDN